MLEPTGDNVMLEIITRVDAFADDVKARSGLHIDKQRIVQDEPDRGRVLGIGPAVEDPECKIGDTVVFHTKDIFQGIEWDGKKLVFVKYFELKGRLVKGVDQT
jgi:hypothetical protein